LATTPLEIEKIWAGNRIPASIKFCKLLRDKKKRPLDAQNGPE